MAEVLKLGITLNSNQPIQEKSSIEVHANKGIVGDRHFKDFNDPYNQISLIESENIDDYNIRFGLNIPYIDFRRNVITKGIKLNDLVGKKIKVGNVELEAIDLCRPCRHKSIASNSTLPTLIFFLLNHLIYAFSYNISSKIYKVY